MIAPATEENTAMDGFDSTDAVVIPRGITIQATGDDGLYIYQTILNGK